MKTVLLGPESSPHNVISFSFILAVQYARKKGIVNEALYFYKTIKYIREWENSLSQKVLECASVICNYSIVIIADNLNV